jgi:hypothetical protein
VTSMVASIVIMFSFSALSFGQENQSKIFLPGSSPYGTNFNQWISKWWQWYNSVPKTESPNYLDYPNHIGKVDCEIRQNASSPSSSFLLH